MSVIALLVPVTSCDGRFSETAKLPFCTTLAASFVKTTSIGDGFRYRFYLGFDEGDLFFEDERNQEKIRNYFDSHIRSVNPQASLTMQQCGPTRHKPCHVWNRLFQQAYDDRCEFFYQLGDDIEILTSGWAASFVRQLHGLNSWLLGLTGPVDEAFSKSRPRLFTQSFVSRTHMSVFGTYFPPVFLNWSSDDWITAVYRGAYISRSPTDRVRNTRHFNDGGCRYKIDKAHRAKRRQEVQKGKDTIREWIAQNRGAAE